MVQAINLQPLTLDEVKYLLAAARGHPDETLLIIALALGLRRGELLALRWNDIDFAHTILSIHRTMHHPHRESGPKTGRREILLPDFLIKLFQQQRSHQDEAKREAGVQWQERDLSSPAPLAVSWNQLDSRSPSAKLEDGRQKQFYARSEKEAWGKLHEAMREVEQGTLLPDRDQRLSQYLDYWLEQIERPTLKIGSYKRYRSILDNHLIPALGHLQMRKLRVEHLDRFYTKKQADGLAPKTIHLIHNVLHKALETAGTFFHPNRLLKEFNELLREAGLPHVRFHDLRHSAATLLLTMGVHPKVVQEILGHSDISMTLDIYSLVLPTMQHEAMARLDQAFGSGSPSQNQPQPGEK